MTHYLVGGFYYQYNNENSTVKGSSYCLWTEKLC